MHTIQAPSRFEITEFVLGQLPAARAVEVIRLAREQSDLRDEILFTAGLWEDNLPDDVDPASQEGNIIKSVNLHEPHLAFIRQLPSGRNSEFPQEEPEDEWKAVLNGQA